VGQHYSRPPAAAAPDWQDGSFRMQDGGVMDATTPLLIDGAEDAAGVIVLAHGAGAPMDSPYMDQVAAGLAIRGLRVVRFEFPYMSARRTTGKRRGPDVPRVLEESWRSVVRGLGDPGRLVIGGKSMGGRIASMVADELGVRGVVCLGYPFHPPGRPERLRTAHLKQLATPALIVQGTRDPFGTREEIQGFDLAASIRFEFLEDGDHSFKPRARSGRTLAQNLEQALDRIATWVAAL